MNDTERRALRDVLQTTKDEKIIREILRLAESFLAAQLQSGLANDLRSMTLAAVLAAIVAGLIGGTATIVAAKIELGPHLIAAAVLAGFLVLALFDAVRAARPTGFYYAGNNPAKWANSVNDAVIEALAGQAALYAQGIEENAKVLSEGHHYINRALRWVQYGVIAVIGTEFVIALMAFGKSGFSAFG